MKKYTVYGRIVTVLLSRKAEGGHCNTYHALCVHCKIMKIIDNSLCNMDFSKNANSKNVKEYIVSLFNSSVDYVEIDSNSLKFLSNVRTQDNFIFRVESLVDFLTVKEKEFAYIVLPLNMLPIAQKLQRPNIIIEIHAGECALKDLYKDIDLIQSSGCACAVRIVKDFSDDEFELYRFIQDYYEKHTLMLDICPLNTTLCGIDAAFNAYEAGSNMLTLSFGSAYVYTPLEAFIAYMIRSYDHMISYLLIPHLYLTAVIYNLIADSFNYALKNLNDIIKDCDKLTENIDIDLIYERRPDTRKRRDNQNQYTTVQNRFFKAVDLEKELCDTLSEIIDETAPVIYNRFLKKEEFES